MNTPNQPQPQIIIQKKSSKGCWIAAIVVLGISVIGIGGCVIIGGAFVVGVGESLENMAEESRSVPEEIQIIGTTVTSEKFEITVTDAKSMEQIKGDFTEATPAQGGIYVVVQWEYKNISNKPISSFSTPSIHLLSSDGTKYSTNMEASMAYSSLVETDEKVLSDLSPGIKVRAANGFEISKELWEKGGWTLLITGDEKIRYELN